MEDNSGTLWLGVTPAYPDPVVAIIVAPAPYDEGSYCRREILAENLYTQCCFAIEKKRKLSAIAENFLQFCRQHPLVQHWSSDKNEF